MYILRITLFPWMISLTTVYSRFATLESVKNGDRLTLSIMKRYQLDGIDNAMEVDHLLRHDFSFYTNMNVNEYNARDMAEIYRGRWGIENGYPEKKDVKEKTHSSDMGVRYFLFFISVLLYNMWVLFNLLRRVAGYGWITLMDYIRAMGRSKWNMIMNDNG